jgi:RHS repeat-associated protein
MNKLSLIKYFIISATIILAGCGTYKYFFSGTDNGIVFRQLAATSSAGKTDGDFSVDGNGGATYEISIMTPPGVNDVHPDLTLRYTSQQGNGALGSGWALNGIPAIQRIGKTIAQDGIKGGVQLDNNDRYAVGGQRLIAYRDASHNFLTTQQQRDAAYGQNGTEYHAEVETWTRFFSYGNCGGGPCYFMAYDKDGSVSEYGNTSDSKPMATTGGIVIEWGVNKVTDNNGNYVTVNYQSQPENSWYYPVSIYYTGNSAAQLLPQRAISLLYQNRNDVQTSYVGAQSVVINNRLSGIQTYLDKDGDGNNVITPANLVRQYNLTYTYGNSNFASLLTHVQECDANNNCLNPTTFTYGRDGGLTNLFTPQNYSSGQPLDITSAALLPGDFNGDGLTDFISQIVNTTAQNVYVYLSAGNGSFNMSSFQASDDVDINSASLLLGDYNGDGLTDFLVQTKEQTSATIALYYASGNGSFNRQTFTAGENLDYNSSNLIPGDFDGDGRIDFLNQVKTGYTSQFNIYYYNNSGPFNPQTYSATTNIDFASAVLITGDFNGDGKTDFLNQALLNPSNQVQVYWFDANGNLQNKITTGSAYPIDINSANLITGDYNGDSKVDFLRQSNQDVSNVVQVFLSDGDGDFIVNTITLPDNADFTNASLLTADFNGDEMTDLLRQTNNETTTGYEVYFSLGGAGFSNVSYTGAQNMDDNSVNILLGDYNGDATTDFFLQQKQIPSNDIQIYFSSADAPNLITSFQDGLGQYTAVQYSSITSNSVYTKGSGASYPYVNLQAALWVTSQYNVMDRPTNPVTNFTYSYKYVDGQVNAQRGWAGFRKTLQSDQQSQAIEITTRDNQFPYTGIVVERKTVDINDTTSYLGVTNIIYNSVPFLGGAVYSVYNSNYALKHYTNGTYNYTLTKVYHYDNQGMNLLGEDNLGDAGDPSDNVYMGLNYQSQADTSRNWWMGFFPIAKKTCSSLSGASNWTSWDPTTDLEWEKYGYDSVMNLKYQQEFRNTTGGINPVLNTWITVTFGFDQYGNQTQLIYPDSTTWLTTFDNVYHTYAVLLSSPAPGMGKSPLTTSAFYDPRFGTKVSDTDANGNCQFAVPDNGLDGLGTILITQASTPENNAPVNVTQSAFLPNPDGGGLMLKSHSRMNWIDDDTSHWVWSNEYWDALNRHYQTSYKGFQAGTILSELVGYDSRGYATKEYVPYYTSGSQKYKYSQNGGNYSTPVYFSHEFDRQGRPTKIYAPDPHNPANSYLIRNIEYLLNDNRKIVYTTPQADSTGMYVKWEMNLNTQGQTISKSGPYDTLMNPLPETATTLYAYNLLGDLISITDPLGEVTSYRYNSLEELIWKSKPETGPTNSKYNDMNQLVWEGDTSRHVETYGYDAIGRMITQQIYDSTGVLFKKYTYQYDLDSMSNSIGKLSRIITPEGTYTYQYDNTGQVSEESVSFKKLDANHDHRPDVYLTRYLYDAMGRINQVTFPDQSIINYNYNRYDGKLACITEGNDSLASFNNYTSESVASYVRYQNEVISNYSYDFLGRIDTLLTTRRAYVHRFSSYQWNQANKLKRIKDIRPTQFKEVMDYSESFAFNNAGRLKTATGPYNKQDTINQVTNTYQYDLAGNETNFTQQTQGVNTSSYNIGYNNRKKHQISQINYSNGSSSQYQFDATGNLKTIRGTENTVKYNFTPGGQLGSVNASPDSTRAVSFGYDPTGTRISKSAGDTTTFYINPLYEVVVLADTAQPAVHTRYVGGTRGPIQAKSTSSPAVTLLAAGDEAGKSLAHGTSYFDQIDFGKDFIFFSLVLFITFAIWSSFYAGRWIWKRKKPTSSFSIRSLVETFVFKKEVNFYRAPWMTLKWHRPWVICILCWSIFISAVNPAQAQIKPGGYPDAGETLFFSYDDLESNVLVTDQSGGQVTIINYKPYGGVAQKKGKDNFRPKYTGKEIDNNTGLYYFGARYYNAEIGRFISPDPAMQYSSPYLYGNDDPLSGTDPDGEFFVVIILITAGIIGAYAGASVANGNANPLQWNWTSGKTWAGIVGGAAFGVALAAAAVAGLAAAGAIGATTATVGGVGAGTIAFVGVDVAFLTYDSFQFSKDRSVENGVFVALDLIPFVGPLIGRAAKAVRAARAANVFAHDAEAAGRAEEAGATAPDEMMFDACPLSFEGDTEVMTAEGIKPIRELEVGDEVWGYDDISGEKSFFPVSTLFKHSAATLLVIILAGDTIATTPEHPFYVEEKGWVEAFSLQKGDLLLKNNTQTEAVLAVETLTKETTVYNISVSGSHNFFVSEDSVLSHNAKAKCLVAKGIKRPAWRKSHVDQVFNRQTMAGKVRSAVSNSRYPRNFKISIGTHGRKRIIWDIDHVVPYRFLLKAADEAKSVVTWQQMIAASNDITNLRIMTNSENVSHAFEPKNAAKAMKQAREILKRHGVKF